MFEYTKSGYFGSKKDCKYKESQGFWINTLYSVFDDKYAENTDASIYHQHNL